MSIRNNGDSIIRKVWLEFLSVKKIELLETLKNILKIYVKVKRTKSLSSILIKSKVKLKVLKTPETFTKFSKISPDH